MCQYDIVLLILLMYIINIMPLMQLSGCKLNAVSSITLERTVMYIKNVNTKCE